MSFMFRKNVSKILPVTYIIQRCFYLSSKQNYCKGDRIRDILFAPTQVEKPNLTRKVSVVGAAGSVGTACAYNLLLKNICDEIVLFDIPEKKEKLCGEALDYLHLSAMTNNPRIKICLNGENTRDSDLLIISAGKPIDAECHLDMLHANACIFKCLIPTLAAFSPDAVILVISNPVDLMTFAAWKYSGFDKNRVIGTGTELDSSRFRCLIGRRLGISPRSINAWIIGEHGKSSVPCWSTVDIAGTRLREIDPCLGTEGDEDDWGSLYEQVIQSDKLLLNLKGSPNWGISATIENIATAVLENKRTVHAVTTNSQGIHGIETDTFFSLPVVLGNRGVLQIVKQNLAKNELERLQESAKYLDCIKNTVCW